jgi:hypothetical protein
VENRHSRYPYIMNSATYKNCEETFNQIFDWYFHVYAAINYKLRVSKAISNLFAQEEWFNACRLNWSR